MELRLINMSDVYNNTPMLELKVVFFGTSEECRAYAEERECIWKDSRRHLYGGYWHRPSRSSVDSGFCLLPS